LVRDLPQEGLGLSQRYISSFEAEQSSASMNIIEQTPKVVGIHAISLVAAAYITSTEDVSADEPIGARHDRVVTRR
jgi:hypothetical protein